MAKKEKVYGTHLKVSTKRAGHKIGGTVGIFVFLLVLVELLHCNEYLAQFLGLFIYGAVNFSCNKFLTFR